MSVLRRKLRIAADKESASSIVDVFSNSTPSYYRGNDIDIEIGFFSNGELVDVSLISSVTLEVKALSSRGGAPDPDSVTLMADTLTTTDLDATVADATWNDQSKQHAVFAFSAAESNIDDGEKWLVISVTTTDAETITWLAGLLVVREDGAGLITEPAEITNYLNLVTADARYLQLTDVLEAAAAGKTPKANSSGKLDPSWLPSLSLTEVIEVADQTARLALTSAQAEGKIVVQLDTGLSYGLPTGDDPTVNGNWIAIGDRSVDWTEVTNIPLGGGMGELIVGGGSITTANNGKLTIVADNGAIDASSINETDVIVEGDSRLTDSRTPTTHAFRHATGGSDELTPADIGAATSAQGVKADTAVQPGDGPAGIDGLPSALNRRAYAGGVWFQTAGDATLAADSMDFGTADFAIHAAIQLNDYSPATAGELISTHSTGNNRAVLTVQTDGDLRLSITDNGGVTSDYDMAPSPALVDGETYALTLTADREGNASLYIDERTAVTVDISGSSAVDIGSGNANTGELMGDANLSGSLRDFATLNFAPTDTQAEEIATEGIGPWLARHPEYERGIPNIIDLTSASPFANLKSVTEALNQTVGGETDAYTITVTDTNDQHRVVGSLFNTALRYRITGEVYLPSTNAVCDGVRITDGSTGAPNNLGIPDITTTDTWIPFDSGVVFSPAILLGVFMLDGTSIVFDPNNATDFVALRNLSVETIGALAAHLPMTEGNGRQLRDISGRYDALLSSTGYAHLVPRSEFRVRKPEMAITAAATVDLLEASDIIPANTSITGYVVDGRHEPITGVAQDLSLRRIRLAESGGTITLSRSNGTTTETLDTFTPTSIADFDLQILGQTF